MEGLIFGSLWYLFKSPQWSFSKCRGRGRGVGIEGLGIDRDVIDKSLPYQDNTWCFITGENNFWSVLKWILLVYHEIHHARLDFSACAQPFRLVYKE